MIDLDITELFEEIVKELPEGLEILYPNGKGGTKVMKSPRLNYIFGSSQYIKDILDEYSKSSAQSERKFPLVALFTPIYKRLLEVLYEDSRFDCDYDEIVKHSYSENYSYGRYGAYTDSGEAVSEPIDAINIRSMEIKINNLNCRRK